ncbi:MAG: hypothetical protein HQL59_09015 [Magnetococcales bacterium]|nr:hypothetical protein [Magnetococcales bacterium]
MLLPRPEGFAADAHPYLLKGSMVRFLEGRAFRELVWIDSDCLVVGPLAATLEAMAEDRASGADYLAITQDSAATLGELIGRLGEGVEPFRRLVTEAGLDRGLPYLNCALFMIRSRAFLERWAAALPGLERHALFEQNLLNLLAHGSPGLVEILDRECWNVHDQDLDRLEVGEPGAMGGPARVFLDGRGVNVIHATSYLNRSVSFRPLRVPLAGRCVEGLFRLVHNESVQKLFLRQLASFLVAHKGLLDECGVLVELPATSPASVG